MQFAIGGMSLAGSILCRPYHDEVTSPAPENHPPLSERDRAILDFERQWWRYPGAKEQAIRDRLGLPATRYYQVLNALLDRPEALVYDPMLVRRLRRLRARRHHRTTPDDPGRMTTFGR
jgi:hypothetical protein